MCIATRQTWSTERHQFKMRLHGLYEFPGSLFHKGDSTVYPAVQVPTRCLFRGNLHFPEKEQLQSD